MKLKTRKLVMGTLVWFTAMAVASLAVADVTIRLRPNQDFVVKDRGGADNFRVKVGGAGVEVPRGPLDIKNKTSGGEIKFYEGSGGGSNSFTVKSPDALAADVTYTLPDTDGAAGQVLQTDGKGMLSWVTIAAGCNRAEEVVDLVATSYAGGRTWMDRNLGAERKALSITDTLAYGFLFQWGRGRDGHECSWRTTYAGPVGSSAVAAGNVWNGKFITVSSSPFNWLSPPNETLWGVGSRSGTTKGLNDPCPTDYQMPNENELTALGFRSSSDAFRVLKLPAAGVRYNISGNFAHVDEWSYYWSSTVSGTNARYLFFDAQEAGMYSAHRAYGISVRCIKSR